MTTVDDVKKCNKDYITCILSYTRLLHICRHKLPNLRMSAFLITSSMLKKIFFYVLASVTLLALIGYYWLGGFNPVIIEAVNHPERVVIGQPYQGRYGDLKLREIFVKTNQAIQAGTWPAPLIVINRDTVMAEEKEINQLIGVLSTRPDTLSSLHYQADTLPAGRYLRAVVQAQPVAMPKPEAVNEQTTAIRPGASVVVGEHHHRVLHRLRYAMDRNAYKTKRK